MEKKVDFKSCLFIAFDLDLTGNKLNDEMTNIGAYGMEEESRFKQYVIPHRNINIYAVNRYLLKTANINEYRVVKDCITRRAVKTKTEIFALVDFLNFLESLDAKKNGICLMHFESSKLVPFILLDALRRYKLLERFNRTVRGFADCHDFVKENCAATIPNFTLRSLVKILLNREKEKFYNAFERSRLIFEIVAHLCEGKSQNKAQDLTLGVCPFVQTVDEVELELVNMKEFLQKQYALNPIFQSQFRVSSLRLRALELRKLLATTDVTYETLKASFEEKNDTSEVLKAKLGEAATENDTIELVKIINAHFEKGPEEAKEKVSRYRKDSTRGKASSSAQKMTDEAPKENDIKEEVALPEPQTETTEVTDAQPEVKTEQSPESEATPGKSSKSDDSPKKKSDSTGQTPKIDTSSKASSPKKTETPTKPKTVKPKTADAKPKSADAKPKTADPKPKAADPKPKAADPKLKNAVPKSKSADPAPQSKPDSSPKPSSDSAEPQQNDSTPKSETSTSALPENKTPQPKQAKIPPKEKPTPKPKQNPKSVGKKGAQPPPNGEPSATLPPASSPAATQAV